MTDDETEELRQRWMQLWHARQCSRCGGTATCLLETDVVVRQRRETAAIPLCEACVGMGAAEDWRTE
jgi:hypothetical protein